MDNNPIVLTDPYGDCANCKSDGLNEGDKVTNEDGVEWTYGGKDDDGQDIWFIQLEDVFVGGEAKTPDQQKQEKTKAEEPSWFSQTWLGRFFNWISKPKFFVSEDGGGADPDAPDAGGPADIVDIDPFLTLAGVAQSNAGANKYKGGKVKIKSQKTPTKPTKPGKDTRSVKERGAAPPDKEWAWGENGWTLVTRAPRPSLKTRPKHKQEVIEDVWNAHKNNNGQVVDPGRNVLTWKPGQKRNGESWQMGHLPGYEYRKLKKLLDDGHITYSQFLKAFNDPSLYRPESRSYNSSHLGEASDDVNKYLEYFDLE
jgi:hypothetical protein